jgi:hypothetical protein
MKFLAAIQTHLLKKFANLLNQPQLMPDANVSDMVK